MQQAKIPLDNIDNYHVHEMLYCYAIRKDGDYEKKTLNINSDYSIGYSFRL